MGRHTKEHEDVFEWIGNNMATNTQLNNTIQSVD